MSVIGTARFCSVFAVFGVVFLVVVGLLFEKEPFYMKGPDDKALAAKGCYHAAAIYFFVWISSIVYGRWYDQKESRVDPEASGWGMRQSSAQGRGANMPYGSISSSE
jgi:hypothetical protein